MKTRATGPYIFVRYTGKLQLTAEIAEVGGKLLMVSAANLLPMRQHPTIEIPAVDESSSITISDSSCPEEVMEDPLAKRMRSEPAVSSLSGEAPGRGGAVGSRQMSNAT